MPRGDCVRRGDALSGYVCELVPGPSSRRGLPALLGAECDIDEATPSGLRHRGCGPLRGLSGGDVLGEQGVCHACHVCEMGPRCSGWPLGAPGMPPWGEGLPEEPVTSTVRSLYWR